MMEPMKLEDFTKFHFLSDLRPSVNGDALYFVETISDLENNDYRQRLDRIDISSGKRTALSEWRKRTPYYVLKDGILLQDVNDKEQDGVSSTFLYVTGQGMEPAFSVPLAVDDVRDFDDDHYLLAATINRRCPEYHQLSEQQRKDQDQKERDNDDYVVLNEYPFVFNGEGVVNGNRHSLFLYDKKSGTITDLIPLTIDVESYDIKGTKILFSGIDFQQVKLKWSWVYEVDGLSKQLKTLYNGKMQITRAFYEGDRVIVAGTFAKDWGAMESSRFYELKNGEMNLDAENELSLYNTIGTDCHFGRTRQFAKFDGDAYFLSAAGDDGVLFRKTGDHLTEFVHIAGSVDDFCVINGRAYVIAMVDQKLQEVYAADNDVLTAVTGLNGQYQKDRYVAYPEPVVVDKAMPVHGWVLKPMNFDPGKKYPVIFDIHGGPKCAYGTVYYHEMQVWAGMGCFVIFCNPRGSDGRGNAFADLRQKYGTVDYEDLMDFVDACLAKYPQMDRDHMGVTGGSYGGYMTNWIIGHTHRFKAAATQRSISNWITEVTASDYGLDFPIEQEFKDIYHAEKELWQMSPLKYANEVTTPTLFIHSLEDYRCPVWEGLQLYMVLKVRGVETKMVLFKGENHELSRSGKPKHRIRRLEEITNWMESHLKEAE